MPRRFFVLLALLAACTDQPAVSTYAGGTRFAPEDCAQSPIGGRRFQACAVSPWVIGSGHASSGTFSARPNGGAGPPGMEGGPIDSEKIHTARATDGPLSLSVLYAVPRSASGAFSPTTPLTSASRVDPACEDMREGACPGGFAIVARSMTEVPVNGRSIRVEIFSVTGDPATRSGFVANIPGPRHAFRDGSASSAVVRGFLADQDAPSLAQVIEILRPLTFRDMPPPG